MRSIIRRFYQWLVYVLSTPLWCDHDWRAKGCEEIGERGCWTVSSYCRRCGMERTEDIR